MAAAPRQRFPFAHLLGVAAAALALAVLVVPLSGSPSRAVAAPAAPKTEPPREGSDPGQEKISSGEGVEGEEGEGEQQDGACSDGFGSSFTNKFSIPCMTEEAVRTIFGLPDEAVTAKNMLTGILKVPDFVDSPSQGGIGGAETLTRSIAFALLLAVVTFTLLHYLAAGFLSSTGSGAIIDGVMRCAGAAILILAWPFLYENAVNITNVVSLALVPEQSANDAMAAMIAASAVGGGIGVGLLVLIAYALLLICLMLVKIGLIVGLLLAFVGMPLALALWPIPALSPPASYAFRYIGMALSVVVMWALCFKVLGAVGTELKHWGGGNLGVGANLLLPLLGIGELLALLSIPRHAVTMWNVAPRKGTVGSMAQFAASNVIAGQIGSLAKRIARPPSPQNGSDGQRPPGSLRRRRGLGGDGDGGIGGGRGPGAPAPSGGGERRRDESESGEAVKRVKVGGDQPVEAGVGSRQRGRREEYAPAARKSRQGYGNTRRQPPPYSGRDAGRKPHGSRAAGQGSGRAPIRSGFGGSGPPPRVHDSGGGRAGGAGSLPGGGQTSPANRQASVGGGAPGVAGTASPHGGGRPAAARTAGPQGSPGGGSSPSSGGGAQGGSPSSPGGGSKQAGPGSTTAPPERRPDRGNSSPPPTTSQQPPPPRTN